MSAGCPATRKSRNLCTFSCRNLAMDIGLECAYKHAGPRGAPLTKEGKPDGKETEEGQEDRGQEVAAHELEVTSVVER